MPNVLIATKTGKFTPEGLAEIRLDAFQNKNYLGYILVNSGSPQKQGEQFWRTVPEGWPHIGELEPCPEGEFDLGPPEFASGKMWDFSGNYREIQSPFWQTIFRGRAIGFHLDGNRSYAPGSAGCLVFKNMEDMKRFCKWQRDFGVFTKLYVDWKRKYVKKPSDLKVPK